jgi:hypothetical protein
VSEESAQRYVWTKTKESNKKTEKVAQLKASYFVNIQVIRVNKSREGETPWQVAFIRRREINKKVVPVLN